jgi:hypothetical protein
VLAESAAIAAASEAAAFEAAVSEAAASEAAAVSEAASSAAGALAAADVSTAAVLSETASADTFSVAVESVVEAVAACCSPAGAAPELLPESAIPAGVTGQNHHTQNASNRHRMTATPAMMRGRESVAGDRSGGGRLGGFGPETTAGADAAAGSETGADVGAAAVWEGLTDFAEREGVPGGFRTVGKASANDSAELLLAALTVV